MGWFGPKRVPCPAGRWTTIISSSFAQMPKAWSVTFDGRATGEYEETKSKWIFPGAALRGPLAGALSFRRGYWNTFYKVAICPAADLVAIID